MFNKVMVAVILSSVCMLVYLAVLSLVKLAGGDSFIGWVVSVLASLGWVSSLFFFLPKVK